MSRDKHKCPGCGKGCYGVACGRCMSKNKARYVCPICNEPHPGPLPLPRGQWCLACSLVADRISADNGRAVAGRFDEGHLERLAQRAARGLPLFERRRDDRDVRDHLAGMDGTALLLVPSDQPSGQ